MNNNPMIFFRAPLFAPHLVPHLARTLAVTSAALWLASCANYKGIESAAHLRAPTEYETAASLPAQQGAWPDASWAQALGGAPLQGLVDEALAGNPGLQAASARIAAAAAAAHAARAASGPGIDASFKSTYQRYTENGIIPPPLGGTFVSDNTLTLNFSYDFDFWGRHAADLRSALAQEKVAEAEQYAARMALTTAVARTWLQLGRQYAQLDLARQQIGVREKIDHLTQLRFAAGLDTQVENQQAIQQLENLRSEEAQLTEAIGLTRNQLAALMGKGPDRGRTIERPVLPQETALPLPSELPLNLLGRRADLVAARWRVEAMQNDIASAKAQFYPNINLTAFAGFSSLGLSDLLDSGSRIVGAGPAIRVPIFGGGALRAQLKGRVAAYDAAVASYNQALTDALHETADQVQSMQAGELQHQHQRAAAEAAAGSLRLARQREHVGTTNMLPVLASEMAWLAQSRSELDARVKRLDAGIGLIKALGGGFDASAQGLAAAPVSDSISHISHSTSSGSAS